MRRIPLALASISLLLGGVSTQAQSPWPGEPWKSSVNLTSLAASDWQTNLSGAYWNPLRRHLWVVNNSGFFHRLVEGGALGFQVDAIAGKPTRWAGGGDAEGITQAGNADSSVLVLNEDGYVEEYATTSTALRKLHSWDIRSVAAPVDGSGPEGIAFVPDAALTAQGFTDKAGKAYASRNGMGGLVFVAHQNGGEIHVFDCKREGNAVVHVASYTTGRGESSDLAFDASIGVLYVWHNIGSNTIEALRLSSRDIGAGRRGLIPIKEWYGPKTGNLEGMGIVPAASGETWYFATDDDNQDGYALMWFKSFKPGLTSVIPGTGLTGGRGVTARRKAAPWRPPQVDGRWR